MAILIDRDLIADGDRIVVAVSGGIDSMVLLDLLASIAPSRHLVLIVAHVDHQRRRQSAADAAFVAASAAAYGIPCETLRLDLHGKGNFHDRARSARYAFFHEIAVKHACSKIALAHQADDQAETILMRLVRGAGFAGYAGIPRMSDSAGIAIVRPLLGVSRTVIDAYREAHLIPYVTDESNAEDHYTRNRFRHRVLPEIAKENPRYLSKFAQFAAYVGDAHAVIARLAASFIDTSVTQSEDGLRFSAHAFGTLEAAVRKEVVTRCYDLLTENDGELSYAQICAVEKIIVGSRPHGSYDLPKGRRIVRDYDLASLRPCGGEPLPFAIAIPGFGSYSLPDGSILTVQENPVDSDGKWTELWYNNLDFIFPMTVRTRANGDRISFAYGTKKLKDLFMDRKVPIHERDRMPLLVGNDGRVLWIPLLGIRAAMVAEEIKIYASLHQGDNRNA